MTDIVGHCPHCGAPIYGPPNWQGVFPPPPAYTCDCRNKVIGAGFLRCEHCHCREEYMGSASMIPHRICCKCGDRQSAGYSLDYITGGPLTMTDIELPGESGYTSK